MNTPISPSPSPVGVWIPLPLAERLFDCYYGGGPRHLDRHARPIPEPVSPPVEDDRRGPHFEGVRESLPRGARPGGILARAARMKPPSPPES